VSSKALCFLLLSCTVALTASCSNATPEGPVHRPEHALGTSAQLLEPRTCDDLLHHIRRDAVAKVEMLTNQYLESYAGGADRDSTASAEPGAADSDGASGRSGAEGPDAFSETNTQVDGVDEADIVKTDGHHIYLLSGNRLFVLRSWPAEETAVEAELEIDGYPYEMFVADGRAVVFSQSADPRTDPEESRCDEHYSRYGYYYPCYSGGTQFTKVTVADLTEAGPEVSREVWVEGHYRTSRRHGDQVRAVMNNWGFYFGWNLPYVWEYLYDEGYRYDRSLTDDEARARIYEWRRDAIRAIFDKTLDDWLPDSLERVDGEITEHAPDCGSFYVTRPGLVDYGMTQVVGLTLGDGSHDVHRSGIWGYAHEVYASEDTMVVTQWDHSAWYRARLEEAETVSTSTLVHRFGLAEDGSTVYEASGTVPGTVVDQFSIDERDGIVRIATTETTWQTWWSRDPEREWVPPETTNQVLTLDSNGRDLVVVGSTPPLAEGERIFSTRFMGDKAYVVTFRQVDPLFAIDLSDPRDPEVLGELKIPGFSNYMHPLDDGHLLTIGRDADEDGTVRGLALQIFDVTDPTSPERTHRHLFEGDRWGHSEAAWDHKAFTFYGHLGLLAFPYVSYGSDWRDYRSSLEVFAVDAETGFRQVGSVDHTPLLEGMCDVESNHYCRSYGLRVRRGVFIDDYVYSISYGGVRVNRVDGMTDVASVRLFD